MKKVLINNTASDVLVDDTGVNVLASSTYEIPTNDFSLWESSVDVITHIVAGDLSVSDGENILSMRVAIALIQDNQIVLNEFYTLVQDDDVLIGNGKILYLNDEFATTENVPYYMDEFIEDDVPTEG